LSSRAISKKARGSAKKNERRRKSENSRFFLPLPHHWKPGSRAQFPSGGGKARVLSKVYARLRWMSPAACSCCLIVLHGPCHMPMRCVHAAWACCRSMLHVYAACPCCVSMLHVLAASPCCISILHVHSALLSTQ
jgi:hypothetical protein